MNAQSIAGIAGKNNPAMTTVLIPWCM